MGSGPTLFDEIALTDRPTARESRRRKGTRPRPVPLASPDNHPEAEARFDVLFTHEQMATLNAASAMFYERWGVRINKSQLLRALVACLRDARPAVDAGLSSRTPPRGFRAPPKAAARTVHRDFEAAVAAELAAAIRAVKPGC